MKILNLINVLSIGNAITNSTIPTQINTNTTNNEEVKEFLNIFSNFSEDDFLNNLSKDILSTTKSTKNVLNSLNDEIIDKIFKLMDEKIKQSNFKQKEIFLKKFRENKQIFKEEFIKRIKQTSFNIKKEEKQTKKQVNNILKRISSSSKYPDWKINDDGKISSKFLLKKYEELNKQIYFWNEIIKKTNEHILFLQKWKIACTTISAATAAGAAACWIGAFFSPPAATAAMVLSATTYGLSIAISTISDKIWTLQKMIKYSNDLVKSIYSKDYSLPLWNMFFDTPILLSKIDKLYGLIKHVKSFSALSLVSGAALAAIQTVSKTYDLYKAVTELNYFNETTNLINQQIANFLVQAKDIEKIGWVVVHETEQEGHYEEGGQGGKNLIFKNLKTGEIKILEQMLKYTDFELSLWNLQRVRDHKKGTYSRTIKNGIWEDNLG